MTIVRRIARPLLAAPLIASGVDAFRHPGPHVEVARPVVHRVAAPLGLPDDPLLIVRASGAVTAAAGTLLALGRLPRLSALAIIATAPATEASPPFWLEKDPELRRQQRTLFLKNLGLVGGALLAAVDTEGRPGLAYRSRTARRRAVGSVEDAGKAAKSSAKSAKKSARAAAREAKLATRLAKAEAKISAGKKVRAAREAVPV